MGLLAPSSSAFLCLFSTTRRGLVRWRYVPVPHLQPSHVPRLVSPLPRFAVPSHQLWRETATHSAFARIRCVARSLLAPAALCQFDTELGLPICCGSRRRSVVR